MNFQWSENKTKWKEERKKSVGIIYAYSSGSQLEVLWIRLIKKCFNYISNDSETEKEKVGSNLKDQKYY